MLQAVRYQIDHWKNKERYDLLRTSVGPYSLRGFDALRCVFVHVPKAGGMSVNQALFGNRGGGHRTVGQYKCVLGPLTYVRYFSFTFVRNPFSRLVSAYTFLKRGGLDEGNRAWAEEHLRGVHSFEQFVLDWLDEERLWSYYHFKPQCYFVCDGRDRVGVDYVGRFEHLQEDFREVCRRLGVDVELAHRNVTGRQRPYQSYYTAATAARVVELYRSDFEVLGYELRVPPPSS